MHRLLRLLWDAEIDFVIVGSFAAVLYGSPLVARDLRVCTALTPENISKLREALSDIDPVHRASGQRLSFLDSPSPEAKLNALHLSTDFGPVDFLGSLPGAGDFESIRANAVEVELFGQRCHVISLDDLIHATEALARDKNQQAVLQLRAIREKLKVAQASAAAAPAQPTSDPP